MSAARIAGERYVQLVNAGDLDALVELFAETAVVLHPTGSFEGRERIRELYTTILGHGPVLDATGWVHDESICAFELEASAGGGTSHAIDHCTVGEDGHIVRMAIAYR